VTRWKQSAPGDPPLNFHPAAIRVSAGFGLRPNFGSPGLVRVAQPIARCGEVGGISRRGEIAQRRVRTLAVVVIGPVRDSDPGVIEAEEQAFAEKLIAHPAVETFAEAVLYGFARCDEVPGNVMFFRPGQHCCATIWMRTARQSECEPAALRLGIIALSLGRC
jgi:hypothetical protein